MSSMESDMTAFPIIRIDQIPIMSSDILRNAVSEIIDLKQSLVTDEGPKHPLLFYLQQQLDSMHAELLDRAARERIGRLLRGEGVSETRSPFIAQQDTKESIKCATSSARRKHLLAVKKTIGPELKLQTVVEEIAVDASSVPLDRSRFRRIPLPSELVRQGSSNDELFTTDTNDSTCAKVLVTLIPTALTAHREAAPGDVVIHSRSGIVISAKADNVKSDDNTDDKNDDSDNGDNDFEPDTPIKRNTSDLIVQHDKMMVRRHKGMSNNVPIVGNMMKRAATALYKDFGSQFLVAGTERKSRHWPNIAEAKTHEELLESGRQERRRAAMVRLNEKRAQQQSSAPVSKLRRRLHDITCEEKHTSNTFEFDAESDECADAIIRQAMKSDPESMSLSGGEDAKNVLEIPIDQAQLLTTLSSIDKIRICNNVSDNCSMGYLVNQKVRGILSCGEMIVYESINSSDRRMGSESGHVSEPVLLDVIRMAEDPTMMLQRDYASSSISTIAAAAATSTFASTNTSTPATTTSAAARARAPARAPAPTPFEPCKAVPAAASPNASDIVREAREEHSIGSRRNSATRESTQSDSSFNEYMEPRHTAANLRAVSSSAVDVVSHESYSAGSTRQNSPPITRNQSPLPFGIFTHPDDVVWGSVAWSEPPFEVSRPMSGITESLAYSERAGEVLSTVGYISCASTHVASAVHDSIRFDDEGSDFTSMVRVQVTDRALTPTPASTPATVLTTPNPVLTTNSMPDLALVHVPVLDPGANENRSRFPAHNSITATIGSVDEVLTGEIERDKVKMTAIWGDDEAQSMDAVEQREWKASSSSFVPRTRSKVRSAPTCQTSPSGHSIYIRDNKLLTGKGKGKAKARSATSDNNAWTNTEQECEDADGVERLVDIPLSLPCRDIGRKSSTAPADTHTHRVSSNDALDAVPSDALRSILRSDEMFNQETNKRIQSTPCRVTASKNAIERKCRSQSMSSCPSPSPLHSMDTAAPSRNKSVCLTDFYPHIGMIFTSVYDALGLNTADSFNAESLVESIRFQAALYEEWIHVNSGNGRSLHYRVNAAVRPEVYSIVSDVFKEHLPHWNELPSGLGLGLSWNLLWTWSKPRLNPNHLLVWQRVNHFAGNKELTQKDLLKRNIQRYTDMSGTVAKAFEIMPLTFQLPHEYTQFVTAFMAAEATCALHDMQNIWILKPVGLSRGRGIELVREVASLTYTQPSVIQSYIRDPLCLDGYKFDLRLYVLVTSFKPLEAFIHTEGFARISTNKYSLDPADLKNNFIHLTNSSIQKQNHQGPSSDNPSRDEDGTGDFGGSKIALKGPYGLWVRLEKRGFDVNAVWRNISKLIVKSLVIVDDKMRHQPCSFEVFGYDVLIDSDLKCWLLEVNSSPSLAREYVLDVRVKNILLKDTIQLIDPAPYDREAVGKILQRRFHDFSKNKIGLHKDLELENDLKEILGDFIPRKYGEVPKILGGYEKLCPHTAIYTHVLKLKSKIIKSD